MKKLMLFALSAFILTQVSCSKSSGADEEEEEQSGPIFTGNITFYITQAPSGGCDNVEVILSREDGTKSWTGTISKTNLAATAPTACGGTTGYTFTNIEYGKYKFNTNCGTRHLNSAFVLSKECHIISVD